MLARHMRDCKGQAPAIRTLHMQVPEEPGEVQRELGISKQASLHIRLKASMPQSLRLKAVAPATFVRPI